MSLRATRTPARWPVLFALVVGMTSGLAACQAEGPAAEAPRPVVLPFADPREGFGGFSGLEVSADGARFLAVSDAGLLIRGDLLRDAGDRLTGLRLRRADWLIRPEGGAVTLKEVDPEGLALLPDGRLLVSFEQFEPPWIYPALPETGPLPRPARLTNPPDTPLLGANTSWEATAADAQGRPLLIPEFPLDSGPDHPIWRLDGDWQSIGHWPRAAGYLPVGADLGPDGSLYVLERRLRLGFAARVRRLDLAQTDARPERVTDLPPAPRANYEGLSVWRDQTGALRLVAISDDNFTGVLRQQIVEISLAAGGGGR